MHAPWLQLSTNTVGIPTIAAMMAARKVSPGDAKDVETEDAKAAPLLDHETRIRNLETTPNVPTLHHLATREAHSFHQTTIYYGLVRRDTPPRRKYGFLAASIGIVILQCLVATGLSLGVSLSTCTDNPDCGSGTFCDGGLCEWCLFTYKDCCQTNSTESCWWDEEESQNMCSKCITDEGFEAYKDVVQERVDSMMVQDWLALLLASIVVSFAVFAEMRDAIICSMTLRDISQKREVPRGWRFAIRCLNFARYYIMLPNVIVSVVMLVLNDGGDVKNVCLNTVAVLFLLEVDNMAFLHGLGERTRMEAEEMAGARVTEDDLQTMNAAKIMCVLAIPGVVFAGLLVGRHHVLSRRPGDFCINIAPLPFMVILFLQRVKASRSKLKGSCGALGWGLAGYIMNLLWYLLVVILVFGRS